jgi:hypothetical protein
MRNYSLLLAPSALCLLAGSLGFCISCDFLGSALKDEINAGRVGLVAAAILLACGGLSLLAAWVLALCCNDRFPWSLFLRWVVVAAIMVIPTALLFGPTGGFHHHIGFGWFPFFYMVWNGEDPQDGFQIVEGYDVCFDPLRWGILVVIWIAVFLLASGIAMSFPPRRNGLQSGA